MRGLQKRPSQRGDGWSQLKGAPQNQRRHRSTVPSVLSRGLVDCESSPELTWQCLCSAALQAPLAIVLRCFAGVCHVGMEHPRADLGPLEVKREHVNGCSPQLTPVHSRVPQPQVHRDAALSGAAPRAQRPCRRPTKG